MKKIIILLILLLLPITINAEQIKTDTVLIGTTIGKETNDTVLANIAFYQNDLGEFGITGTIENKIPLKTNYELVVNYYDLYNNKVFSQELEEVIKPNKSKDIITKTNINENPVIYSISKYSIEVITTSKELDKQSYTISNYNINIEVREDNTYKVTENITVEYKNDNKPFIRTIPINLKEDLYKKTSISNLKIDSEYSFRKTKDNYIIEIDGTATKDSKKEYQITYEYNYGKDSTDEYDILYYVLNGITNDTVVTNLTFNIEMPKEVDKENIEMAIISKDVQTNKSIVYTVDKNTISGRYMETLYPDESMVVQIKLPNNYFEKAKEEHSLSIFIMIIVPMISVMIAFAMWYAFGKDNKYTKKKITTVPDRLNSMEIGYLYKGRTSNLDLATIILDFANRGYIKIEEDESDFSLIKSFELHKLKEYRGKNNKERLIFENLFKNRDVVTPEDIDQNFYNAVINVTEDLNDTENQGRIFENTNNQTFITVLLTIISLFTIMFIPSIEYGSIDDTVISIFMISLYILIYAAVYSLAREKIFRVLIVIIIAVHTISYIATIPLAYALINDIGYLLTFIFGLLCLILLIMFIKIMPKRTIYGNKMLGRIMGFKNYLENITKDEIKAKLKDNPNFFYDMLPYTIVLGISNVWIKKFENIKMTKPEWTSVKPFHFSSFCTFITHGINTLERNIRNYYR